ncbi:hypothetical protein DHB64_01725 [Antarcticibacterium sp. W02-3]|nr:hypothetical protein [Antarcticibacterium sp. W02-3]
MNWRNEPMERIENLFTWNKLYKNAITIFLAIVFSFFIAFLVWLETEMSLISSIYSSLLKNRG